MSRSRFAMVALCAVSTFALTFAVLREPAVAASIKCLFAETTPGQGTIEAEGNGSFEDSHVWDVYASTATCSSSNICIDIVNVDNMNPGETDAVPSSYNMCSTGGGGSNFVYRGYRAVGIDGYLLHAEDDGTFDADIYANETGGLSIDSDDLTDVDVNENVE